MARSVLDQPQYRSEEAALAHVERLLWPNGPVCPFCKSQKAGKLQGVRSKPSKKNPQGVERHGLYKCYGCRKQFTVRKGTVFEDTHLPMHLWLQVIYLMQSSKKAISTAQVQRLLNCSMETAWFLTHRVREMMRVDPDKIGPLGGSGHTLEADETYIGAKAGRKLRRPPVEKQIVMTLVERDGRARSFHVPNVRASTVRNVLSNHARRNSTLMTDEAHAYTGVGWQFKRHDYVNHSQDEYVRDDAHTNTVEGFFSILKRGLYGVYQHVSEAHLHRYLSEFDFRYNNRASLGIDDTTRTNIAVQGAAGKRLTYERFGTVE
jgi:transposase-like protein